MNPFLLALCAASLSVSNVAGMTPDATVRVDASKVEANVTPWLYGACIEDVNHEIYGGLYDQRLFGESFEEPVPDPPHERRDVEPYEDDEPCVAGPPYCERPAPYEDDPYEERDHREPEPYEEP